MAKANFETLDVYRLSERLADEVWKIAGEWDYFVKRTIGAQLVRACDGIGSNIAEGAGRGSFQDNRRFIRIARGSLNETQHWLRRTFHRNLLTGQVASLEPMVDELGPRLNASLKSIGTDKRNSRPDNRIDNGPLTTHH